MRPIQSNGGNLIEIAQSSLRLRPSSLAADTWEASPYKATPTIIEAAKSLYREHGVSEITRSDASHKNLTTTSAYVKTVVSRSRAEKEKSICFITGVPGSGKTLAGLNIATELLSASKKDQSVFLSGNGPLVDVLREALVRDNITRARERGIKISRQNAARKSNTFIQNVHHFRDDQLATQEAPINKVVVFDEAQRAWNQKMTASFMKLKKNVEDFSLSEPGFLLSVMDRHDDWCTVVCLVGEGQEINRGEAGLKEWLDTLQANYPHWNVFLSPRLETQSLNMPKVSYPSRWNVSSDLHLEVSLRSFRSERVSEFINYLIEGNIAAATESATRLNNFPIAVTRDLKRAKDWIRSNCRGTERCGMLASSNAIRLRPFGMNVKVSINPSDWFLNEIPDVRSSNALEEPATEFDTQGLEVDWALVGWDANLRWETSDWETWSFKGTKWQAIRDSERKNFLKNAYRVLLTRARQGLVVFIPPGDDGDSTRMRQYYDPTYELLKLVGLEDLDQ